MSTQIKTDIETVVRDYISTFGAEYELFKQAMRMQQTNASDDFAEMEGSEMVDRKLGELPETLHAMIKTRLTDQDYEWFRSKVGAGWFFKKFKDFRASEKH